MDTENLLNEAIDLQERGGGTLAGAIETVVQEWLSRVAGEWTAAAERNHVADVARLARARGYILT
jgi:hypothetical protein